MTGRLAGKVAVVTGGASGIGEAAVRRFVAEGARVVIADVQVDPGSRLAAELGDGAAFVETDVSRETAVAAAVEFATSRFGKLDIMINNAGFVGAVGSIMETSESHFRATLSVMQDGVFFGIKHAARAMVETGGGAIVSVASVAAFGGGFGPHVYTMAKHAVVGLTRTAASELKHRGIRVNAVAPGTTVSALIEGLVGGDRDAAIDLVTQRSPMNEVLMPRDIANALLFMASDEAKLITGQILAVDAGTTTCAGTPPFHSIEPAFYGPQSFLDRA